MGLFKSIKKVAKSVGIPTNFKDAMGNAATIMSAGLVNTGSGTLGQSGSSGGIFSNLVNGAVGLGSDYLQNQSNLNIQKDLAKWNAEQQGVLNDKAFQQNLQMWNLKNQYDSPAEQMKRYEAAGLNKNLIYGQSNTSGNVPELQAATYDAGRYNPVDTRMQRAQLGLALAEQHQRVTNQAIENDLARQRLSLAERNANREDALARAQIDAIGANLGLTNARIGDIAYKQKPWFQRIFSSSNKKAYDFYQSSQKKVDFDFLGVK